MLISLAGCDKLENAGRGGDRKVDLAVNDSIHMSDPAKAAAAVKNTIGDASNAGKARASSELARDEYDQAMALLSEINRQSLVARSAMFDLDQAAGQITGIQDIASGMAAHDPQTIFTSLDSSRAQMQQSLDKAKSDAASLKADLDNRQKEIEGLKTQRQQADTEADSLENKSNEAKGEEALKLFKQSTEARTQSGTLAAQIETKSAALMPLQRQLAIAEAQVQLWDSSVKDSPGAMQQLDERKSQLAALWQDAQHQAEAMNLLAKKVATDVIVPGGSADRPNAGARYEAALSSAEAARIRAVKLLQSAAQHADDAGKAAKALNSAIAQRLGELKGNTSSEATSLQALVEAFDENQYLLQKGNIDVALGNLNADGAALMSQAKMTFESVSKAMTASGQTMPSSMAAPPDPAAAQDEAAKAYKAAEDALESIANITRNTPGIAAMKSLALSSLLEARYGHFELNHDAETHQRLRNDIARAREASVTIPASLRGM